MRLILILLTIITFNITNLSSNETSFSLNILHKHVESANSYAKSGQHEQALNELNNAISKAPKYARAFKIRANVHFAKGDYAKALEDFNALIQLAPDRAQSYVDRSIVYHAMKNQALAKADIQKALSLDPNDSFAKSVLARINSGK